MDIKATIKGVRMSPRKIGLVAGLVRGRTVADALEILQHTPKRAAKPLAKAIASAKANALTNHRAAEASLTISHLQITAGPRLKRFRPAAMGRALPYQKRSTHISITLIGTEKPKKAPKSADNTKQPAAKAAEKKEK